MSVIKEILERRALTESFHEPVHEFGMATHHGDGEHLGYKVRSYSGASLDSQMRRDGYTTHSVFHGENTHIGTVYHYRSGGIRSEFHNPHNPRGVSMRYGGDSYVDHGRLTKHKSHDEAVNHIINKHKFLNEEVEQVDEVSKNLIKSYISKARQSSDSHRRAALDSPIGSNDESKHFIKAADRDSHVEKATRKVAGHVVDYKAKHIQGLYHYNHFEHPNGNFIQKHVRDKEYIHFDKSTGKSRKFDNHDDLIKHVNKVHGLKEEIEPISELSKNTISRYIRKASADNIGSGYAAGFIDAQDHTVKNMHGTPNKERSIAANKMKQKAWNRVKGISSATERLAQGRSVPKQDVHVKFEEVEPELIDETSKKLTSYSKKKGFPVGKSTGGDNRGSGS